MLNKSLSSLWLWWKELTANSNKVLLQQHFLKCEKKPQRSACKRHQSEFSSNGIIYKRFFGVNMHCVCFHVCAQSTWTYNLYLSALLVVCSKSAFSLILYRCDCKHVTILVHLSRKLQGNEIFRWMIMNDNSCRHGAGKKNKTKKKLF